MDRQIQIYIRAARVKRIRQRWREAKVKGVPSNITIYIYIYIYIYVCVCVCVCIYIINRYVRLELGEPDDGGARLNSKVCLQTYIQVLIYIQTNLHGNTNIQRERWIDRYRYRCTCGSSSADGGARLKSTVCLYKRTHPTTPGYIHSSTHIQPERYKRIDRYRYRYRCGSSWENPTTGARG